MSTPPPEYIANLVVQKGTNTEPVRLDEVIVTSLRIGMPKMSEEEIFEWTEEHEEDVARELFQKETDSLADAVRLNFDIFSEDDGFYIKFVEKPEMLLLRSLIKESPDNFETFCGRVLTALGGTSTVTASSHDRGIDFWSSEIMMNRMSYHSTVGSRVLVVGQAKKYALGNHIKETDLREFIGAAVRMVAELKRTRTEQFGLFQPTVLAYWTTSDFHKSAKEYARELGIWYLGGPALCQLALSLGVSDPTENSIETSN